MTDPDHLIKRRKKANVTIRADILTEAKALGINISRAAEAGVELAVKRANENAWLADNADSIREYNERIDQFGTLLKPTWLDD